MNMLHLVQEHHTSAVSKGMGSACLLLQEERGQDFLPHLFFSPPLTLSCLFIPFHPILSLLFTFHFIKRALRTCCSQTLLRHVEQIWNIKFEEDPAFKKVMIYRGDKAYTYVQPGYNYDSSWPGLC